ncbi:MAG: hypothetical protein JXB07_08900 [Anaerolineae bacterium]|nr:hypothetical protein [Anaerolineae bacterium]
MLDWYLQPRHWSPCQTYATGDVVMNMISQGWQVTSVKAAPGQNRAKLHVVNLSRDDDSLDLLVLDGPAIRGIAMKITAV